MTHLKYFLLLIIILLPIILPSQNVFAYLEQTAGGSLIVEVTPKAPKASETVKIRLTGYGFDLNNSRIVWMVNNKVMSDGIGLREFSFVNGVIGTTNTLNIVVQTKDERTIIKNLIFRPADIDLLFEAKTQIPNFYEGAPLPTQGSPVKVVAIPHSVINKKDLTVNDFMFSWSINGNEIGIQSGVGKNILTFSMSNNKAYEVVGVTMSSKSLGIEVTKQLAITPTKPEVLLYQNEPLTGPRYEKSLLGTIPIDSDFLTVRAEPFYFAPTSQLTYLWQLNAKIISGSQKELNIETPPSTSGSSTISVTVSDLKNNLLQAISTLKTSLNGQF